MRLGSAGLIVSGGLRRRCVRGNRRDAIRESWESAKKFWQLGIYSLGDVAIGADQGGRIRIEELRIGAQHVGERGEITGESRRCDDAIHLDADAPHLGQTQIVNLLRSPGRGRLNLDVVRVPRRAIG